MRINNSRIDIFKVSITNAQIMPRSKYHASIFRTHGILHSFALIGYGRILHIYGAQNETYIED